MEKVVEMDSITQVMAQRMKDSWLTSPRVTYTMSVDIEKAEDFIRQFREKYSDEEVKLSYNHILMKACAMASMEYPKLRSSIDEDKIIIHDDANIGLAVATEKGLIVPNVKGVNNLDLIQIVGETDRIIEGARTMRLNYDDICGGTLTITNLGMYGVEHFTPIINQPEVAILGVNKIQSKLVIEKEQIREKRLLPLDLVADHRIIDGALAATYLKRVKEIIEHPEIMTEE